MFPVQLSGAPRPVADIIVWGAATTVLAVVIVAPTMHGFADSAREPLSGLEMALAFGFGGVGGFVYWLLAGRLAPPYDR